MPSLVAAVLPLMSDRLRSPARMQEQDRRREKELLDVIRTHEAGGLRAADPGTTVTLAGWVARRRGPGGGTLLDFPDAAAVLPVVLRGGGQAGQAPSLPN